MEDHPLDPTIVQSLDLLGQNIIAGLKDLEIPENLMAALIDRDPRLMDEAQRAVLIESLRRNRKEVLERKRLGKRAPRKPKVKKSSPELDALRESISIDDLKIGEI